MKVNNKREARDIMALAISVGQMLLENGAEIYRAEDTVQRICESRDNLYDVDVFGLTSAIFVSLEYESETINMFKTVGGSSINLEKIHILNDFSRRFVTENMSTKRARVFLKSLNRKSPRSLFFRTIFAGVASGFFSILFGASPLDFIATYLIAMIVYFTIVKISKYQMTFFIENFIGAFLSSSLALISVTLGLGKSLDTIIIGVIMLLVPGVAITNAVRDIMSGDFLSGLIGLTKAVFAALAIALGVGVVLNFRFKRGLLL
ncbi:MAG: threonine/serine exporter family protein [Tissierellia bacterium]|nr:threonine/serine exporter family protein [Tissierellia bacterium]